MIYQEFNSTCSFLYFNLQAIASLLFKNSLFQLPSFNEISKFVSVFSIIKNHCNRIFFNHAQHFNNTWISGHRIWELTSGQLEHHQPKTPNITQIIDFLTFQCLWTPIQKISIYNIHCILHISDCSFLSSNKLICHFKFFRNTKIC